METSWIELGRDESAEITLARDLAVQPLTARLLVNRGITTRDEADRFLRPSLTHLHDPFGLPDMDKAARRIADAIGTGETIFVYGDYDADGVTSTAVYVRALTRLGAKIAHRVPNRLIDGYDLQTRAVDFAHAAGASIILTTDCGIQARSAVDYANSLGLCVIITDHHEPGEILPAAYAVVNPRRKDSTYAFPALAGVGVAFKTVQAVTRLVRPEWESALIRNFLDLVSVGTIADVMPLMGENRVLAYYGLQVLRETKKVGLRTLVESIGLDLTERLNADTVGFALAPRINAVGRLDDAAVALELLLTSDAQTAVDLVEKLAECNRERQRLQRLIQLQAIEKVISLRISDRPVLVVADKGWNPGLVGIVAGKLVEQFHRPAIVIAVSEDGLWGKGSARSIEAFDMFRGISQCADLLETCGGHARAAGLSIAMSHFDGFYDRFCEYASQMLRPEDFEPSLTYDTVVDGRDLTIELLDEWEQLHPFGEGNPPPRLVTRGVTVGQKRRIGKDMTHLKFSVDHLHSGSLPWSGECIAWGAAADWDQRLGAGDRVDILYTPQINQFQGRRSVQLVVQDFRISDAGS